MRIRLFVFVFCVASELHAADNSPVGARSAGLANASVLLSDNWSCFNNQAGLAYDTSPVAGVAFENRFLINDLSVKSFSFALPTNAGSFGLSASMFGYNLYNEKKAAVAYAKKLGKKVAAGIQADYLNTFVNSEYYGSKSSFVIEGGIIAEPLKNFLIGFHLYNPNRAKLAEYADERIPTIIKLGASYRFSEKSLLTVEEEKDIDQKASFKSGVEYHIIDALYLRTGIGTNPTLFAFGFGLKYGRFVFDAASTYHQVLGFSPSVSLNYEL